MSVLTLLLIILLLLAVGAFPAWGHPWGYGPSGFLLVLVVVLLVLLLMGRL